MPFRPLIMGIRPFKGEMNSMLDGLINSERVKVIAVVAVVAIGTGVTAKSVISFPTECTGEQKAYLYEPAKRT
ncbi:hypothetical protein [Prochlorococcus sp. MIT 1307]|uniref:hypothetical protein n=1 Tax=Prochlorococcus sp. MIT 1307 TaxID=3096219 RepID=UPI002A75A100|nr:hypothetical protein [Prochlorococcus sp. MIT 1307]